MSRGNEQYVGLKRLEILCVVLDNCEGVVGDCKVVLGIEGRIDDSKEIRTTPLDVEDGSTYPWNLVITRVYQTLVVVDHVVTRGWGVFQV